MKNNYIYLGLLLSWGSLFSMQPSEKSDSSNDNNHNSVEYPSDDVYPSSSGKSNNDEFYTTSNSSTSKNTANKNNNNNTNISSDTISKKNNSRKRNDINKSEKKSPKKIRTSREDLQNNSKIETQKKLIEALEAWQEEAERLFNTAIKYHELSSNKEIDNDIFKRLMVELRKDISISRTKAEQAIAEILNLKQKISLVKLINRDGIIVRNEDLNIRLANIQELTQGLMHYDNNK